MKIFGLLGDKRVFNSLSPLIHNALLTNHNLNGMYIPIAIKPNKIEKTITNFKNIGIAGMNITTPYKETVLPLLNSISTQAKFLGAVNTIVFQKYKLLGYNTDVYGFGKAIKKSNYNIKNKQALIFGAGGATRAVVISLLNLGIAKIIVTSRNFKKTKNLADDLGIKAIKTNQVICFSENMNIIINTTSVSNKTESPKMAKIISTIKLTKNCRLVIDINYGRKNTFWEKIAHNYKIPFINGMSMLIYQAKMSFKLWTNIYTPTNEFTSILKFL